MVGHRLQSIIANPFTIDGAHIARCRRVTHDGVNGDLIASFPGNCLEAVTESVEAEPGSVQLQLFENLRELLGDWIIARRLRPRTPVAGQERQTVKTSSFAIGVFACGRLGPGALLDGFPKNFDRLGP
jgi:hypothetical protein